MGIGGSAGGLEAFSQLLQHLPVDTGMAFIFVQHLDPEHESVLSHILSRATTMPVHEAAQGMALRPNEIFVIPPGTTMSLSRRRIVLKPRELTRTPHHSIDFFFQSLAREQHEGAIGVVFSGNATDGTNGLEAIKAAGGITFAQDKSAKYDSMPRSAIASGCVDFVMAPEIVARELARIATHPYLRGDLPPLPADFIPPAAPAAPARRPTGSRAATPHGFAKILELARDHSGVDFSLYKTSTVHRRITRRTLLSRKNSLEDYARFVAADVTETKALYSDLLISVTSFFRDEAAFEALKKTVFPRMLNGRRSESIRMWTIGCSSGQEAYSLAMAFMESTEHLERVPKLQIFGTDLNETLLTKARHGLYPKSISHDISPERLRRFFVEEDGGYRVIKALREMCIFGRQDVLGDPPFSRMDLVTCRNVLIYFEAAAQKRVMPMLHYALKPEGFLFLGTSETVGTFDDLFDSVDRKQKIFARKSTPTPSFSLPLRDRREPEARNRPAARVPLSAGGRPELHAHYEADRLIANRFGPPGVLVDAGLNVLQFRGATDAYLMSPSGKPSIQLLKIVRDWLVLPMRSALNQARKQDKPVRREKVRMGNTKADTISIQIIPLKNLRERYYLVLFEDPGAQNESNPSSVSAMPPGRTGDRDARRRVAELERELRETRDYLQSLQQQHDTAHDELQASNEEVQSTNEELQSINEELETSKEELESGNEELITVNEEMAYRNSELSRLNSDLNNFHVSINTPIVVLGRDLTIRRFTPMAEKLFNLLAADVGRPIGGIKHNLQFEDLEGFVGKVIDLLAVREVEVRDKDGHWHLLRARPYLTVDNKIDGAVIVLLDIDALKRSEQAITQERDYAEAALRTARDSLVILRPDLTVNTANDAFYRTFDLTPAQAENRPLFDLADGAWNIPALRELLADILPRNHVFNDLEVTHHFGGPSPRTMLLNGRRLENAEGTPLRILLSIEDITERLRSRAVLRASEIRYRRLFEAAQDGVLIIDPETRRITDANPIMVELLGYRRTEVVGRELFEVARFGNPQAAEETILRLREKREIRYGQLSLIGKDGVAHDVEIIASIYDEDGREVIQCNVRDITERKQAAQELSASEERYRNLFNSIDEGFFVVELILDQHEKPADYRFLEVNPSFEKLTGLHDAKGKTIGEIAPEFDSYWLEVFGTVVRTGAPVRVVNEVKGLNRWFDVYAFRTGEPGSKRAAIIFTDVTERRQIEDALRRSEARFQAIVTQATAGIAELDLTGKFTLVNERFCTMVGRTAVELLGLSTQDITHPDDMAGRPVRFTGLVKGRADYSVEKRYVRPDGSIVWVSNSVAWITDQSDVPQGFVEIAQDITERKRLEAALKTSEIYFRELMQSLPIGVWTSLPHGLVDFVNRHWLDYTGTSLENATQGPGYWTESLHPDDLDRVMHVSKAGHAAGEGYALEARFRDMTSGDYRWFLKRSVPMRDAEGNLQKRIGICIDIEDLKRAQGILADHAGALEGEVLARTSELRETIGELEAFSYSVSHDMRAPLRAMQGFALLLLKNYGPSLDPVSLDQLQRINTSARRLDALISDVLTYSRLLRSEIVLRPIDLGDLVRQVITTYPHLQANGAEIAIEGILPPVLANEASLTQCISNLLTNAVKFVAPGTAARVRVHAQEIEGDVRLWIEDNGIGIDPQNHQRIWNIFTQIGRPKDYEGTGIGLAIVRKAVERMNGKIGLESALGQGSKFWLRLRRG